MAFERVFGYLCWHVGRLLVMVHFMSHVVMSQVALVAVVLLMKFSVADQLIQYLVPQWSRHTRVPTSQLQSHASHVSHTNLVDERSMSNCVQK